MQVMNGKVQQSRLGARPVSGSALLAGRVVAVMIPTLAMSDGLLAIGDEWSELLVTDVDNAHRATIDTHRYAGTHQK